MLSREDFDRQRAAVKRVERQDGALLAGVSVGLGLAQLLFLRWADVHLERRPKIALSGTVFVLYIAIVLWLLWRYDRRRRAARPKCPRCGVILEEISARIGAATGRCDACGGQLFP